MLGGDKPVLEREAGKRSKWIVFSRWSILNVKGEG